MNVLLRKITIISDEDILVLNKNLEKTWFGKDKLVETITTVKKQYEYWIEFHVDQGRFYYGETKSVEDETRKGVYIYQTNTSHTKRGLDKSLEIISEIRMRAAIVFPKWKIQLYQHPNITIFRQFDKDKNSEY